VLFAFCFFAFLIPPMTEPTPAPAAPQPPAEAPAEPTAVPRPDHQDLASLPPNGYVEGVYSLMNPQVGTTRTGKPYLKCLLRDATGEVPARQWSFTESRRGELGSTGYVWVAGHTQVYNGQVQIILEQIKPVEVSEDHIQSLLPATQQDIDAMFQELAALLRSATRTSWRSSGWRRRR
jgi:hypothetical protein